MKTQITELFGIEHPIIQGGMANGRSQVGAWSCGMVAGLIHDVPSVQALIDRIMSEADSIINTRLSGLYL
jgi:nitronate monooxygenase